MANTLKKSKSGREKDISLKSIKVRPSFTELPTEEPIAGDFLDQEDFSKEQLMESSEFKQSEGFHQVDSESFLPDFVVDEPGFRSPDIRPKTGVRTARRRLSEEEDQNWVFLEQPHRIPMSVGSF